MAIHRTQIFRFGLAAILVGLVMLMQPSCAQPTPKLNIAIALSEDHYASERLLEAAIDLAGRLGEAPDTGFAINRSLLAAVQMSILDAGQQLDRTSPFIFKFDIPLQSGKNIPIFLTHDFLIQDNGSSHNFRDLKFRHILRTQTEQLLKDDPTSTFFFSNLNFTPLEKLENQGYKFQCPIVLSTTIKIKEVESSFSIVNLSGAVYIGEE